MRPRNLSSCLPNDVIADGIDWDRTWVDLEYERYLTAKAQYQRDWMAEAHQELARIAILVEQDRRELELAAHWDKIDGWWREQRAQVTAAEEKKWKEDALKKLAAVKKSIDSTTCYIERKALEERGVIRGRRH
jgi:hypothetical protein